MDARGVVPGDTVPRMTSIRIPTEYELADRLSGVDRLLTARKWERAAIVFAFTDVGGPRNTPNHTPPPPKLNIRQFAAQGYAGLTTPKAVNRYRDAWVTAIGNGWAVPVEPGDEVELPEGDFPAWPSPGDPTLDLTPAALEEGAGNEVREDVPRGSSARRGLYGRRPLEARLIERLSVADEAARRIAALTEIPTPVRDELIGHLAILHKDVEDALTSLGASVSA